MNLTDSITYRQIEGLEDIQAVVQLQSDIWSPDVVSPVPQLVASIHNGGIIIGAFFENQLVGFCYGFAGVKKGEHYLVSHMTGVRPEFQNYGVGYKLKLEQREWAIANGYQKIVWTYDPLEIRNGFFNLNKLGAYARTYFSSYYGEMEDKLNKGLPSDRLLIEWDICSLRVVNAILGELPTKLGQAEYDILLNEDLDEPLPSSLNSKQKGYLVSVPTDFQKIKQTNMDIAKAWRMAIRNVFTEAFSKGYEITGVQKAPYSFVHFYILENRVGEK